MNTTHQFIAFTGHQQLAAGSLAELLPVLKERFEAKTTEQILAFDQETGAQVDFDLRGSIHEILARLAPEPARGPGRPRLGVVSREISLLPRHWTWLEAQSRGASATLRRLVEAAAKAEPGADSARRIREALGCILTSLAGDLPGYEEASRALYAGDLQRFQMHSQAWPADIRDYALQKFSDSLAAENEAPDQP